MGRTTNAMDSGVIVDGCLQVRAGVLHQGAVSNFKVARAEGTNNFGSLCNDASVLATGENRTNRTPHC